jgi:hypothetical protein
MASRVFRYRSATRLPREAPVHAPTLAHCAWPSLRHDQLAAPNHLSVDNLTRLARRSLLVAARRFAPCRHAQALDTPLAFERSHAPRWGLLPGASALTGAGLSPAQSMQPELARSPACSVLCDCSSGRTVIRNYNHRNFHEIFFHHGCKPFPPRSRVTGYSF